MIVRHIHALLFWSVVGLLLVFGLTRRYGTAILPHTEPLLITEFVAANKTGLRDNEGDYSDWIEIHNTGSRPLTLAGWFLTDDPDRPEKWPFPEITLAGDSYLVVFASGKNRTGPELHTNFKLDRTGDFLALYNVLNEHWVPVTSSNFPDQFADVAYGRYGEGGQYGYFEQPSPGQPNSEIPTWEGAVAPVEFSRLHGFYDQPFPVELRTATPEAEIYYTLDGTTPSETNGQAYHEPLLIEGISLLRAVAVKPHFRASAVGTQSYLFVDQVMSQSTPPEHFPATWGVHAKDKRGFQVGEPVEADYEMDPEIVDDPAYHERLRQGLMSIPTVSLVFDPLDFDIYANPLMRGRAWERLTSAELIYPDGDRAGFQVNAGLRIQGNIGRETFMPKHSFRLFFREEYGTDELEFPLFPDSPVTQFDTLILRGGVNRSYAGYNDADDGVDDQHLTTYTRDQWLRDSQIAMSGVGSHGIFVHLYLNGLYWGLYNLVERPDANFAAAYLGGDNDEWYSVSHGGPVSGAGQRFDLVHDLAAEGGGSLLDPQQYALIENYLDTTQFSDYVILNLYAGSRDWASNNWYAAVRNPEGRVNYFAWDAEMNWIDGAQLYLGSDEETGGGPNRIKTLFWALLWNVDYKMAFADRVYKHLFNDGALTKANVEDRWLTLKQELDPAIIAESARWGDARYETPITYEDWLVAQEAVLAQMDGNGERFIALLRKQGLYPEIDPPQFNQPGGLVTDGFAVTLTAPEGRIYYTLDGSDPRLKGSGQLPPDPLAYWTGLAAPGAQLYQAPIVLTNPLLIKARVLIGDYWSPLTEATFEVVDHDPKLRITEIMYNPLDGSDYEFIELKNVGQAGLELSGMSLSGIRFAFLPTQSELEAGEFIVLVRDPVAFAARYPGVPINGVYDGNLSNEGELIVVKDQAGQVVTSVSYEIENGWPISPDGRGDSLVLVDEAGSPNDPANWRASTNLFGSPGADDPPRYSPLNR